MLIVYIFYKYVNKVKLEDILISSNFIIVIIITIYSNNPLNYFE